jgi:hypothetical protein
MVKQYLDSQICLHNFTFIRVGSNFLACVAVGRFLNANSQLGTHDAVARVTALKDCFASLACDVQSSYYPSISMPPPAAALGRGGGRGEAAVC